MTLNGLVAVGVLIFITVIFLTVQTPAPSIEGLKAIPLTFPDFVGWSGQHAAVAKITVLEKPSGARVGEFMRGDDGQLYESPQSVEQSTVRLEETPIIPFGRRLDQLGTFAGYFNRRDTKTDRFQVGLHYEPCTLFFGTVGPSIAITKDLAGLGLVVRAPRSSFPALASLGVGVWECAPFRGTPPSWMVGAEFHINLP